jgi:glycosyltransferase involved in cell wall biosynthesis
MRIAIDCRLWNEGGVGRYLRNLILELGKIDSHNEYTLFFWQSAPVVKGKNFHTQITRAKWHSLREQLDFGQELGQGRFDLVHFPYFSHPIFYNRPFVITIHDLTIKHFFTGRASTRPLLIYALKRQAYLEILAHGIRKSRKVLVPSQFVKEDLLSNYPLSAEKIKVTYEGLGGEFGNLKPTKPVNAPKNFWLYVGNAYPHKNLEFLLTALTKSALKETLVIYGPDDYFTARLKRLVKELGLGSQVCFFVHHSEAELAWFYSQAKALVLPSLAEGFGLPVVEAAAHGCPLLLSDIEVFREIAPPGTQFFDPHDVASLQAQLAALPKQRLKVARSYFAKFSFAKMAKETLLVYESER